MSTEYYVIGQNWTSGPNMRYSRSELAAAVFDTEGASRSRCAESDQRIMASRQLHDRKRLLRWKWRFHLLAAEGRLFERFEFKQQFCFHCRHVLGALRPRSGIYSCADISSDCRTHGGSNFFHTLSNSDQLRGAHCDAHVGHPIVDSI